MKLLYLVKKFSQETGAVIAITWEQIDIVANQKPQKSLTVVQ